MSSMSTRFDYIYKVHLELIALCWPYNPSKNVSTLSAIFNFDLNPHVKNACQH